MSIMIQARELDQARLFFGVGVVDFLPAEIFLTTLHVRFSSRVKKDLGGCGARKENKPTRYRAVSII